MALACAFRICDLFRVDSRLAYKLRIMTRNEQRSGLLSFSATMSTSPEVQAKKWRFSGYRFDFEEPLYMYPESALIWLYISKVKLALSPKGLTLRERDKLVVGLNLSKNGNASEVLRQKSKFNIF